MSGKKESSGKERAAAHDKGQKYGKEGGTFPTRGITQSDKAYGEVYEANKKGYYNNLKQRRDKT